MNAVPETCNARAVLISRYPSNIKGGGMGQVWRAQCRCGWDGTNGNARNARQEAAEHLTIPCQGLTAKGEPCKRRSEAHKPFCSHHGSDMDRGATLQLSRGLELTIGVTLNGQWFVEMDDDEQTLAADATAADLYEFVAKLKDEVR